jgi:hypothetical protein
MPATSVTTTYVRPDASLSTDAECRAVIASLGNIIQSAVQIRECSEAELYVDPSLIGDGYYPFKIEFFGPAPSPGASWAGPLPQNSILTPLPGMPYLYSMIGAEMAVILEALPNPTWRVNPDGSIVRQ